MKGKFFIGGLYEKDVKVFETLQEAEAALESLLERLQGDAFLYVGKY